MRIINRYSDPIFVRAFAPKDGAHAFGITERDMLRTGEYFDWGMGQDTVQLEFKNGGYGYRGTTIEAASTDRQFSNAGTTVFAATGRAVDLSNAALRQLMNPGQYFDLDNPSQQTQIAFDYQQVTGIGLTLLAALVTGYAQPSLVLGAATASLGLASVILSMFQTSSPPSLQLSDITQSLQKVIDENEARTTVPHILSASDWFDKYVKKSAALQKPAPPGFKIDLKPYDREQFVDELNKHLDEVTPFLPALAVLTANRDIRKHAIPEYILGVGLHLHMERIQLLLKQEKEPLDQHDITSLKGRIDRYKTVLSYSEDDFKKMRDEIFQQYPLANPGLGGYEEGVTFVPESPEAIQLGKGITVKYLKGDRWIIKNAIDKLAGMNQELNQLRLN
jgi:hypothetical protein